MNRECGLLSGAGKDDERFDGAADAVVATVRVANVIATASGAAHAGQNRLLVGASAPHAAQRIILCILPLVYLATSYIVMAAIALYLVWWLLRMYLV